MPFVALFLVPLMKPLGPELDVDLPVASFSPSKIEFDRQSVFPPPEIGQLFSNVQIYDTDRDGKPELLACDIRRGYVVVLTQNDDQSWSEQILNEGHEIASPSHVTPMDIDQDGDLDYLVSALGSYLPTNELVGGVHWLENTGDGFVVKDILRDVRRVTDVQGGDFDGDGDIDLVVAVFGGLLQGQILWLENNGYQQFTDYEIMTTSGVIHVPVDDFDNDGDLDFAAIVTQEEEEVWAFENLGNGFNDARPHRIFSSWNFDLGGSGMIATDLDQDGDQDLLMSLGDNLELINNFPQPWHGCIWLENKGNWKFEPQRIANVPGVYGCAAGDLDADGDQDVVLVTMFNDWSRKDSASIVWLENDGQQNFSTWQIATDPIQLATVDCGDVDQDGKDDIVTGCFQFRNPIDRRGSVDVFLNRGISK